MIFSKIAKVTVLTTVLTFEAFAVQGRENGSKNYDWDPLMDAITHVESRGDSRAVSGRSCGAMQITPILVQQCNIILKENTQELVGRAVHVSGVAEEVDKIAEGKTVYHMETLGRSKAATILLEPGEELKNTADITVQPMNLQQVFVAMCGKEA